MLNPNCRDMLSAFVDAVSEDWGRSGTPLS